MAARTASPSRPTASACSASWAGRSASWCSYIRSWSSQNPPCRAASSAASAARERVRVRPQREVAEREPDAERVVLPDVGHEVVDVLRVRALEVAVLDERDQGVVGTGEVVGGGEGRVEGHRGSAGSRRVGARRRGRGLSRSPPAAAGALDQLGRPRGRSTRRGRGRTTCGARGSAPPSRSPAPSPVNQAWRSAGRGPHQPRSTPSPSSRMTTGMERARPFVRCSSISSRLSSRSSMRRSTLAAASASRASDGTVLVASMHQSSVSTSSFQSPGHGLDARDQVAASAVART